MGIVFVIATVCYNSVLANQPVIPPEYLPVVRAIQAEAKKNGTEISDAIAFQLIQDHLPKKQVETQQPVQALPATAEPSEPLAAAIPAAKKQMLAVATNRQVQAQQNQKAV